MSTIRLVESVNVISGNDMDGEAPSCSYIPGSPGYGWIFFGVNLYLRVAVTDDAKLYVALNGGVIDHNNGDVSQLVHTGRWEVFWGHSNHSFSITEISQLPSGGWSIGDMNTWPASEGSAYVNASITMPTAPAVSVGDDSSKLTGGWHFFSNISDLETDGHSWFNFYVSFPVYNHAGQVSFETSEASKVRIDGSWVPKVFEYYPWGRQINNEWWSHNRSGGSLTRYSGSAWADIKNREDSANDSKGFRYNGSSWEISPKTGREA